MSPNGSSPDRGKPPNFYLLKVRHKKLAFPDLKRAVVDPDTSSRPTGAEKILTSDLRSPGSRALDGSAASGSPGLTAEAAPLGPAPWTGSTSLATGTDPKQHGG